MNHFCFVFPLLSNALLHKFIGSANASLLKFAGTQSSLLFLLTSDGGKAVGTIEVSLVKMGEIEDGDTDHITTDVQGQKCAVAYEHTAPESVSRKDDLPLLNAVLKNPVCKLYRFPTSDNKWMQIREQMSESILSFHIPKELISLHIKEDLWSSFKSSSSKGEKTLEFVPINLHLQRMQVHSPCLKDALYDVITVGAPAAHFQGFKNGGLRKLLHRFETERRNTGYQFIYYSPENTAKAKEVLNNINQLQPLVATHADLLLSSASQRSPDSLKMSLKLLSEKTELFVHAFKDQLVRSALLALYTARPGGILKKPPSPKDSAEETSPQDEPPQLRRQDSIPHHSDYDEEEWDRVWANVGKSLNCIIATVDKLIERDCHNEEGGRGRSSKDGDMDPSLEDSITSHPKGDEIGMLEDMAVGISDLRKVAFKITEAKSSDDLPVLTGRREHYVVEVKLPASVFESLPLQIKEGQLLHVYPVLFNVGINEQQTLAERNVTTKLHKKLHADHVSWFFPLDISNFQEQNDLKGLLDNLHQNIQAKKRKNVEIMWLAATICRKLNGIRFTCCKSAKDRTSMSVTLEQCSILRDEHQLHKDFFIRALDCMRRYYICKFNVNPVMSFVSLLLWYYFSLKIILLTFKSVKFIP
ncbi:Inpp4b [Phodopus roborovskii]|uniref:Inpp4b protein n=1 Tax=Phodopus roborovskii TaxID=109678 RepID=A0AAV0A5D8_PHORO|nr:Inpp4b [Phodopus roborovskii]